MKPHFIPLFFALSVTLSAAAATPCAENTVCAQTNTIEGHGFGNSAPTFEVPSDDDHTIGRNGIKVDQLSTEDEDGDSVDILSVKYHWCVDTENYCFQQNSRELVLDPNQIDKVFTKGTGFKNLTVAYSGEMQKGYPEETRKFTSEATEVDLAYPVDKTPGICYEAQNVLSMNISIKSLNSSNIEREYKLSFSEMALEQLPGVITARALDTEETISFYPTTPKFQTKKLPTELIVRLSYDNYAPTDITLKKTDIPPDIGYVNYNWSGPKSYNDIVIKTATFDFNMTGSDQDRRTSMVYCEQFGS